MSNDRAAESKFGWVGALTIAGLYLVAAITYGVTIPIFESPDASGHYSYIHELTEGRGLPVHGMPSGDRVTSYVAGHTPLYYALCAGASFWVTDDVDFEDWAWRNPYFANGAPDSVGNKNYLIHTEAEAFPWTGIPLTVHLSRFVSALLGAVAVLGTYGTAWELAGLRKGRGQRFLALGAAALTAFNPQFVFIGARLSNDVAVAAFGSLVIWGSARLVVRGLSRKGLILLGVAVGLTALSKLSGVTLAPAAALALVLDRVRRSRAEGQGLLHRTNLLPLVTDGLILVGVTILVCGWWFIRNFILYGEFLAVDAWISRTATVWPEPIGFLEVIPHLQGMEMSYWAMFGWFNIAVPGWMYQVWWVLVRVAAIGLLVLLVRQWTQHRLPKELQAGIGVVAFSLLVNFGSVYRFLMIVPGAQGRYLFATTAAISTLLVIGLDGLVGSRGEWALAAGLAVTHLAATVAILFMIILPSYAQPPPIAEQDLPDDLVTLELTIADTTVQLLGGKIEVEEAHPGGRVPVTLYWRTDGPVDVPYVADVRLLGQDLVRVGGTDGYPGNGTFPPNLWEPGLIYQDRYTLQVDENAGVPGLARLQAGLRIQGEGPLPYIQEDGEPWPGIPTLDVVPLRPASPIPEDVEYPVGGKLGEGITLVGADLSEAVLSAGEGVTVTLVWRAETELDADFTAFVHLLDSQEQLVAQADGPPLGETYPTSWWAPGDVVRGPHLLMLPPDVEPGIYTIRIGMYDPVDGARLLAADAEGNLFAAGAVPVTTLEVR
jgi:hypothetical protein